MWVASKHGFLYGDQWREHWLFIIRNAEFQPERLEAGNCFFVVKHPSVLGGNVNYFVHLLTRFFLRLGILCEYFCVFCFKAISTKWKVSWCWDHRTITVDFFYQSHWSLLKFGEFQIFPCWKCHSEVLSIPCFFETEIRMGWIPMLKLFTVYEPYIHQLRPPCLHNGEPPWKLFRPWTRVENLFWWWMWTRSESTWPWPPWPRWGLTCDFPVFSCK